MSLYCYIIGLYSVRNSNFCKIIQTVQKIRKKSKMNKTLHLFKKILHLPLTSSS